MSTVSVVDVPRKSITIRDINGNTIEVEPATDYAQVPDFLLIFIITISANYVSGMFPPDVQKALQEKPWVQHLVAIMFFLVTVVWAQLGQASAGTIIANTLIAYFWFLLLFRMSTAQFIVIVALTGVVFLLSKVNKSKTARFFEIISIVIVVGLTIGITMMRLFSRHKSNGIKPWNKMAYNDVFEVIDVFS